MMIIKKVMMMIKLMKMKFKKILIKNSLIMMMKTKTIWLLPILNISIQLMIYNKKTSQDFSLLKD